VWLDRVVLFDYGLSASRRPSLGNLLADVTLSGGRPSRVADLFGS
jgi:hypothetical protein